MGSGEWHITTTLSSEAFESALQSTRPSFNGRLVGLKYVFRPGDQPNATDVELIGHKIVSGKFIRIDVEPTTEGGLDVALIPLLWGGVIATMDLAPVLRHFRKRLLKQVQAVDPTASSHRL